MVVSSILVLDWMMIWVGTPLWYNTLFRSSRSIVANWVSLMNDEALIDIGVIMVSIFRVVFDIFCIQKSKSLKMVRPRYTNSFYDEIRATHMGSRKETILLALSKNLKKYPGIVDGTRNNLVTEAAIFPRLAFLNPAMLALGLYLYSNGIREKEIKSNVTLLEKYIPFVDVKSKKPEKDGIMNDMVRYLLMVQNHYNNKSTEVNLNVQVEDEAVIDVAFDFLAEQE